jgi:hypothetical protein
MVDWLRIAARHWFLLPPALLLLAVASLIALAAQGSTTPPWIAAPTSRWGEHLREREHAFVCVLVVLDPSLTGPQGFSMDRRQRLTRFVVDAVSRRARQQPHDRVGLVVLGPSPRLVLRPTPVNLFFFPDDLPEPDSCAPDLGAGLRLALDAFPRGCNRRILLLSDGADSNGNTRDVARAARSQGVPIDIVPPPAGEESTHSFLSYPLLARTRRHADMALLDEIRVMTNGRVFIDTDLAEVVTRGLIFQAEVLRSGRDE